MICSHSCSGLISSLEQKRLFPWNKRNGSGSESSFTFSCVLFGCSHSPLPSLVTWCGGVAGGAVGWHSAETSFCWFPGCIGDLRTQYLTVKIKYSASDDFCMEQSHTSQSAWASQIAIPAKSPSCILHMPFTPQLPPRPHPSSDCGSLGCLCIR